MKAVTDALSAVQGGPEQPRVTLNPCTALIESDASVEELIAAEKVGDYEVSLKA